jgi:hypothetical protein
MQYCLEIPEEIVKQAADYCKDDEGNNFLKIWKTDQEYKSAGLTPIYYLDEEHMDLFVIAEETFGKKLN